MEKLLVILALAVVTISVKGSDDYDDSKSYPEIKESTYAEAIDDSDNSPSEINEEVSNNYSFDNLVKLLEEINEYETESNHAQKEEDDLSTTTEHIVDVLNSQTEDPIVVIQTTPIENETAEFQNVTLADIVGVFIRQTVTMEVREIAAEIATAYLNPNEIKATPDTNVPVVEVPKALIQSTPTETGVEGSQNLTLGSIMEDLMKRELALRVRRIAAEIATGYLNANRAKRSTDANSSSQNGVYPDVARDKVSGETSYPYPYYHERK